MKVGRNDPCPCGSGKKYKKCCLAKQRAATPAPPAVPPQELAAARLKAAIATAPRAAPPERPPPTPEEARAQAAWDDFETRDFEGRIAAFQQALEDPALLDDELAFAMLERLHDDAVKAGERAQFAQLVAALRERQPAVYDPSAVSYLWWLIVDALAEGRYADVPDLARFLADLAATQIDAVSRVVEALAYHGQLDVLVELSRRGWPHVRAASPSEIFPWAVNAFANRGVDYEVYAYLEHTATPNPADPGLLERVQFFVPEPFPDSIAEFIGDLTGQAAHAWKPEDFILKPPPKQKRRAWDDDEEDKPPPSPDPGAVNLARLITEFTGYQRRVEGVSYARGELVRQELDRYFARRHAGELNPQPSMMEAMLHPNKKLPPAPKPRHPLCPERVSLDVHLSGLFGFMTAQYHTAAALFEAMPAWLRFLESRGLLDADTRTQVLADLRPLHASLVNLMKQYADDPTLHRALQAWPETPRAESIEKP